MLFLDRILPRRGTTKRAATSVRAVARTILVVTIAAFATPLAVAPVAAAAAFGQATTSPFAILQALGAYVAGNVEQLVSLPLIVGFVLGMVADRAGRMSWKAGIAAWNALVKASGYAAHFGVIGLLLAAVIYFG